MWPAVESRPAAARTAPMRGRQFSGSRPRATSEGQMDFSVAAVRASPNERVQALLTRQVEHEVHNPEAFLRALTRPASAE